MQMCRNIKWKIMFLNILTLMIYVVLEPRLTNNSVFNAKINAHNHYLKTG